MKIQKNSMHPFKKEVATLLSKEGKLPEKKISPLLEAPPREIGADLAFPCFSLAKELRKNPVQIAAEISQRLRPRGLVKLIEQRGPYVNFYADWGKLGSAVLHSILTKKEKYGSQPKKKEKVLIEFAHPNTHKAYHIGHIRNIALGESLSRILEFSGLTVIRANYQGDIGPHVAKCLWGLLNLDLEEPKEGKGLWLGKVYAEASRAVEANEKLQQEVREINKKLYARHPSLEKLWKKTRQWSLDYFEDVYRDFGVEFDRLYFESEVESPGVKLAKDLLKKGIAKMSEGAIVMDLKPWNLGIYVLVTQDNTPLYSIKDFSLAQLQEKEFHPQKIIHVVGTEQILHFRQLFKGLEFVHPKIAKKEFHLPYELVNLPTGKMSSREGNIITYDELKKEVYFRAVQKTKEHSAQSARQEKTAGIVSLGAIKYDMLRQSPEKVITFDWEQALSLEGNTAPYLQYTHARACSIMEKAKTKSLSPGLPKDEREIAVVKALSQFPEAIIAAARDCRPHYIATYAYKLAGAFNDFYQNIPVLKAEASEKQSRLAMVKAVQTVLKKCLFLLGIEAPEKM